MSLSKSFSILNNSSKRKAFQIQLERTNIRVILYFLKEKLRSFK